jgi:predicted kinase
VPRRQVPRLIVMAGLPGTGKSTVADGLARLIRSPVVSVDPIEAALWRAGIGRNQPTGLAAYLVAEAVAAASLALNQTVIVDAVNPVEPAREQWRILAARHRVLLRLIETVCSDEELHRSRLEHRHRDIEGFREPTWDEVMRRQEEVEPWFDERLVLDTVAPLGECVAAALDYVGVA